MDSTRWFAGIGSRRTPTKVLQDMQEFAYLAALLGWGLRSGAAEGADSAFELGAVDAGGATQIFLPKQGHGGHQSPYFGAMPLAVTIASQVHPVWNKLGFGGKALVARNMHQIAGPEMNEPVEFVICWTPDGCENRDKYSELTGGTGSAIAFADLLGIPVFNIWYPDRLDKAYLWIRDKNPSIYKELSTPINGDLICF